MTILLALMDLNLEISQTSSPLVTADAILTDTSRMYQSVAARTRIRHVLEHIMTIPVDFVQRYTTVGLV